MRHPMLMRRLQGAPQSERGSRWVERIQSIRETCRLQERSVLQWLIDAVTAAYHGRPSPLCYLPPLKAPNPPAAAGTPLRPTPDFTQMNARAFSRHHLNDYRLSRDVLPARVVGVAPGHHAAGCERPQFVSRKTMARRGRPASRLAVRCNQSLQYFATSSPVLRIFALLEAPNTMDAMFGCAQTHSIASLGGMAPDAYTDIAIARNWRSRSAAS